MYRPMGYTDPNASGGSWWEKVIDIAGGVVERVTKPEPLPTGYPSSYPTGYGAAGISTSTLMALGVGAVLLLALGKRKR